MAGAGRAVAVIGAGSWGLALAAAAARSGTKTRVHSRRTDVALPPGVERAEQYLHVEPDARLVILAVPSPVVRDVARRLGDHLDGRHLVLHGIRGLTGPDLETIGDVIRDETPARRIGALGGPALSEDLLADRPSVLVCGSNFPEVTAAATAVLGSRTVRLYTTRDLRGVEWASALVGCRALAVGYGQGAGMSVGITAAFISRAMNEASRLAQAVGAEERTMMGLAGYGDLLAAIGQGDRPEVRLGRAVARGAKLDDALASLGERVEVVELAPRVAAWADKHKVPAPIFHAVVHALEGGHSAASLVETLMTGPLGSASV
jgi:glycerol-3-phosphate dehydrogenase (NAD(P)+)